MLTVKLYSRDDCRLCDEVKSELEKLAKEIPHRLEVINVDKDREALKAFGEQVPVVVVGPYQLKAPLDPQDLLISMRAAQRGDEMNAAIDRTIAERRYTGETWTKADRFSYWLSKHYLALLNIIVLIYVGLPLLAPALMKAGATAPAGAIYRVYSAMCHQMAFRSWFLFGPQTAYPRAAAGVEGLLSYEQATGLDAQDLWSARAFNGNETLGYKIALCERDIAIYLSILAFGLVFGITGRKFKSYPWYFWAVIALVPIGLDGLSQLASQPPFNLIPYRESTPLLRALTGMLFGGATAWFGYPMVEETMVETKKYMEDKIKRLAAAIPGPAD